MYGGADIAPQYSVYGKKSNILKAAKMLLHILFNSITHTKDLAQ